MADPRLLLAAAFLELFLIERALAVLEDQPMAAPELKSRPPPELILKTELQDADRQPFEVKRGAHHRRQHHVRTVLDVEIAKQDRARLPVAVTFLDTEKKGERVGVGGPAD